MSKSPEAFDHHVHSRSFTPDFSIAAIDEAGEVVGYVLGSTFTSGAAGRRAQRSHRLHRRPRRPTQAGYRRAPAPQDLARRPAAVGSRLPRWAPTSTTAARRTCSTAGSATSRCRASTPTESKPKIGPHERYDAYCRRPATDDELDPSSDPPSMFVRGQRRTGTGPRVSARSGPLAEGRRLRYTANPKEDGGFGASLDRPSRCLPTWALPTRTSRTSSAITSRSSRTGSTRHVGDQRHVDQAVPAGRSSAGAGPRPTTSRSPTSPRP